MSRSARRRAGRSGRGFRLSEDAAQHDQQVDAAAAGIARHRRIRPQRRPRSRCATSSKSMRAVITLATLHELHLDGKIETKVLDKAIKELGINPEKPNPVIS